MPKKNLMKKKSTIPMKSSNSEGLGSSMKQGFGLGLGVEGARTLIDTISGSFSNKSNEIEKDNNKTEGQNTCNFEKKMLDECIIKNKEFIGSCDDYYHMYKQCKINYEN